MTNVSSLQSPVSRLLGLEPGGWNTDFLNWLLRYGLFWPSGPRGFLGLGVSQPPGFRGSRSVQRAAMRHALCIVQVVSLFNWQRQ
ncbi:hypothetical protein BKA69DRAFT_1107170 [Paraphysoderma sedebokerense]|nr:hypothetical protein BKA69DRAFT_1107170 [Paraphysoderma sedebokerense]